MCSDLIERILDTAAALGVKGAGYVLLRLPLEVRDIFREWLMANFPDRCRHVFRSDRAHPRYRRRARGEGGGLCPAAASARGARYLSRMADGELPGPLSSCVPI